MFSIELGKPLRKLTLKKYFEKIDSDLPVANLWLKVNYILVAELQY